MRTQLRGDLRGTFNIASEIGEEGTEGEGTFRLSVVIKFSKPLLVYLRRTESRSKF